MIARPTVFTAVLLVTLPALTGCVASPPPENGQVEISPQTSSPETPPDDASLVQAGQALADAYGRALTDVAIDPTGDPATLASVMTQDAVEVQRQALEAMRSKGLYFKGYPTYTDMHLTQRDVAGDSFQVIACKDVATVRAFNSSNEDVTPATRDEAFPVVLDIVRVGETYKIDRSDAWDGRDRC